MVVLYYTVPRKDIRATMPNIPVLISAASCVSWRQSRVHLKPPRLPPHITCRAADCGGFAVITRWGGNYPFSMNQYVTWLSRWQPGPPQWAAMMDRGLPGGSIPNPDLVKECQAWTTAMAWETWKIFHDGPWSWTITLHGYTPDQYVAHARVLLPLIREINAFYMEASTWDEPDEVRSDYFRIGLGSLCRRSPRIVAAVAEAVSQILGTAIPLHAWGCKLRVLQCGQSLPGIISMDSSAWNGRFGPELEKQRKSGLTESAYAWRVSQPTYAQKVAAAQAIPKQLRIFGQPTFGDSSQSRPFRFDEDYYMNG